MRIHWLTWLACAIGVSIANAQIAQISVSPSGDDANPGTGARPVRTLAKARDLARANKATQVVLTGGLYRLSEPLRLGPEDSGVTYTGVNTAPAIISGGLQITGWKLVDAKRNLWS